MAVLQGSGKGVQIIVGATYTSKDLKRAMADLNGVGAAAKRTQSPINALGAGFQKKLTPNFLAMGAAAAAAGAAVAAFAIELGVKGVQAAIDEEKSVTQLKQSLDNLGMGFAMPYLSDWIDRTQRATGVADDQLRPALGRLAQSTGNLYEAQKLLNLAMDISAGTGKDLTSVTTALAKAAGGQFTALRRLVPGLDGTVLATKDLNQVTAELSRLFGGQASARANTFAGMMDRLSVAANELLESFGKGFLGAFQSAQGSVDSFMANMKAMQPQIESIGKTFGDLAATILQNEGAIRLLGNAFQFAVFNNLGPLQLLANALGLSADNSDYMSTRARSMSDALSGTVSSGIQQATDDMGALAREAELTDEYFANLNDELKVFSGLMSDREAVRNYQSSLDDLRSSLKENGKSFDENTRAGRDNQSALDDIFDAAVKVAEGQQTAAEKIDTMRQASNDADDALKKMGVPPDVRNALLQPFDDLITKFTENNRLVGNLKQAMEQLPTGSKTFTYNVQYVVDKGDYVGTPPGGGYQGGSAYGGFVGGHGGSRADDVPAMLSSGEFVIQAPAVSRFGVGFFSRLNQGINPLMGMSVPTAGAATAGVSIGSINVTAAPGESAEQSLPRALRRMSFLAGI